ncbi:uncharacterized protein LOC132738603 [Ruditapes philippinarum]|uniref:uncharacterized protein LOC132738603 n=1 Tax=Ruditapes philippinarum TaxID=129788 RepID=UPI00295AA780|nr:uncharacterized protein LOC132738603 [Ruditapes philippinarum]
MGVGQLGLPEKNVLQHAILGFRGVTVHAPVLTLLGLETIVSGILVMTEYVFNNRVQMGDGQAGTAGLCVVLHVEEELCQGQGHAQIQDHLYLDITALEIKDKQNNVETKYVKIICPLFLLRDHSTIVE